MSLFAPYFAADEKGRYLYIRAAEKGLKTALKCEKSLLLCVACGILFKDMECHLPGLNGARQGSVKEPFYEEKRVEGSA